MAKLLKFRKSSKSKSNDKIVEHGRVQTVAGFPGSVSYNVLDGTAEEHCEPSTKSTSEYNLSSDHGRESNSREKKSFFNRLVRKFSIYRHKSSDNSESKLKTVSESRHLTQNATNSKQTLPEINVVLCCSDGADNKVSNSDFSPLTLDSLSHSSKKITSAVDGMKQDASTSLGHNCAKLLCQNRPCDKTDLVMLSSNRCSETFGKEDIVIGNKRHTMPPNSEIFYSGVNNIDAGEYDENNTEANSSLIFVKVRIWYCAEFRIWHKVVSNERTVSVIKVWMVLGAGFSRRSWREVAWSTRGCISGSRQHRREIPF